MQASATSNGLPVWWDEFRKGAGQKALEAVGQLLRDSWTASSSLRGGMGENLSKVSQTSAIAPLIISGEADMEERSHQDRVVVVRLGIQGKNPEALGWVMDEVSATGGGQLGRALIGWLTAGLDREDPLVAAGAPRRADRQAQGIAVLEWGWSLWVRFCQEVLELDLAAAGWDLDLSGVTAERAEAHEHPEIEALLEAIEMGAHENTADDVPVAWIEDGDHDQVAIRPRAFWNWARRAGYVLPGGSNATTKLLGDRFAGVKAGQVIYRGHVAENMTRRSGWRLYGVLAYAKEHGVSFERHGSGA